MRLDRWARITPCLLGLLGGLMLQAPAGAETASRGRVTVIDLAANDVLRAAIERIDARDHAGAAELLEQWLAFAREAEPEAFYWLGVAYYSLGETERALEAAERAVAEAREPPESWVRLVAALLLDRGDHAAAIPWLTRLVEMAPSDKTYWLQLSSAYQRVDDYERALATMRLAYTARLLTDDADFRRLADLLVHNGLPYEGAAVLERALADNVVVTDESALTKLAIAWIAAGELDRAVTPLERAARSAATGDAYLRLGELHVARRDWSGAIAALERALEDGQLADAEHAKLLLGIGLYGQGRYGEARRWLAAAAGVERHRALAESYLSAIDARLG